MNCPACGHQLSAQQLGDITVERGGETDWLDTLHLAARGSDTAVRLDSLLVRMPGLDLAASVTALAGATLAMEFINLYANRPD